MAGQQHPWWKKALFTGVMFALSMVVLDLSLRACGYRPAPPTPFLSLDPFEYYSVYDPWLGFRNRPNGRFQAAYFERSPLSSTDSLGYRNGYGWRSDGGGPIVLFVGDSITFCAEVNDDETGPSEVAKRLSEKHDLRVLNAGVRGYNTLQAKRMLLECFERFPSIRVAVYTFCGNDVEENLKGNFRLPARMPYLTQGEDGSWREVEVPDTGAVAGQPIVDRGETLGDYGALGRLGGWMEEHSAVWHYCMLGSRRLRPSPPRQAQEVLPGDYVPPEDYDKWHKWALENGGAEAMRRLLADMHGICRDHKATFLVTCYPAPGDVETSQWFESQCEAAGVRFVDLQKHLIECGVRYTCRYGDGRDDGHLGAEGTKVYAAAIAPVLDEILCGQRN